MIGRYEQREHDFSAILRMCQIPDLSSFMGGTVFYQMLLTPSNQLEITRVVDKDFCTDS